MLRVQVLLLAALAAWTAEIGEAGLTHLAETRATIAVVAGAGVRTVQRVDEPDGPGDPRQVRFAVAADGRYDIVLTVASDPDGERTRFISDGRSTWEISLMAAGEEPLIKERRADSDLIARLIACLRLDLAQLRRDYAVELVAGAGELRELRLVPIDPAVTAEVTRIVLTIDPADRPVRLVLDEPSGNRQRLEISEFRDDPALDPGWFSRP